MTNLHFANPRDTARQQIVNVDKLSWKSYLLIFAHDPQISEYKCHHKQCPALQARIVQQVRDRTREVLPDLDKQSVVCQSALQETNAAKRALS